MKYTILDTTNEDTMPANQESEAQLDFPTIFSQHQSLGNRYPVVLRPHVVRSKKDYNQNPHLEDKKYNLKNSNDDDDNDDGNDDIEENNYGRNKFDRLQIYQSNLRDRKSKGSKHSAHRAKDKNMRKTTQERNIKKRSIFSPYYDNMQDGYNDDINSLIESKFQIGAQDGSQSKIHNHASVDDTHFSRHTSTGHTYKRRPSFQAKTIPSRLPIEKLEPSTSKIDLVDNPNKSIEQIW